MRLHVVIPIPPSINHAYIYRNGKRIRTQTTKNYDAQVVDITTKAMKEQKIYMFPDDTKLYMDMIYYFPDNRCRDTHNSFKIPMDAMEGLAYRNDRWVLPRVLDWTIDRDNPRVEIDIYIKK